MCLTEPVGAHRHVVLAFITSRVPDPLLPSDLAIETLHPDFVGSGLRVDSTLRLHRLITVTAALIKRDLGALSPGLQAEVDARLMQLFHLP